MNGGRVGRHTLPVPVRILVTGDTHFSSRRAKLPSQLTEAQGLADLTIHTGDFCSAASLERLFAGGPVLAVAGNNEEEVLYRTLPNRLEIDAAGKRLVVTHGHLERGSSAKKSVQRAYAGKVDLVIFGHSHQPCWEEVNGTWFLNPGSPTQRRRAPTFSFATLWLDEDGQPSVEFSYFNLQ